jgi:hypothetical protein
MNTTSPVATTALVLSIIGLVLILVPYLGPLVALVALIFAIIARVKTPKARFALPGLILSIIALVVGLVVTVLISVASSYFLFGNTNSNAQREQAAQVQRDEPKEITLRVGETATLGPFDFRLIRIERNYTLAEGEDGPRITPSENAGTRENPYGKRIPEAEAEYVLIEAKVTSNGSNDIGSDYSRDLELNNVPLFEGTDALSEQAKDDRPERYIFRIRQGAAKLTLKYDTTIRPFSHPIFGTEGVPTELLTYRLELIDQ